MRRWRRFVIVFVLGLIMAACGSEGDGNTNGVDGLATTTTAGSSDTTVPVDFGDEGEATKFLELVFMPRSSVSDEQVECIKDELAVVYPDGIPDEYTDELAANLDAIGETCLING